jgi:hypothetical protein
MPSELDKVFRIGKEAHFLYRLLLTRAIESGMHGTAHSLFEYVREANAHHPEDHQ